MNHTQPLPLYKKLIVFFSFISLALICSSGSFHQPTTGPLKKLIAPLVKYNELLESDVIIQRSDLFVSLFEGSENGKRITESNGDPYANRNGLFRIVFVEGKGYTIAPAKQADNVICISRSDYSSDADYKKPNQHLWLYTMLNGGNQFWNIQKVGSEYLIQNTNSQLYIGYSADQKCLIQTTMDKACKYTFSRQGNVVDEPIKYADAIGTGMILSSGFHHIERLKNFSNGAELTEREGDASWVASGLFKIEFHPGKGYTIASASNQTQVICTGRTNYANDSDYLRPDQPLWFYEMLNGGNQYWNLCKEGSKYWIQNRYSGLFIGYNQEQQLLVQTTKDKARLYTIYPYIPPPPPPPKVYECIPIPGTNECMMALTELEAKTIASATSSYGSGKVTIGQYEWTVADDTKVFSILNAFKSNSSAYTVFPLYGGLWIRQSFSGNPITTWIKVNDQTISYSYEQLLVINQHPNDARFRNKVILYRQN